MIEVKWIPFEPEHIKQINLQVNQRAIIDNMSELELIECISAIRNDTTMTIARGKQILAICSISTVIPNYRYMFSMFLSQDAGTYMYAITKMLMSAYKEFYSHAQRIEASAQADFIPANRWLLMFGFTLEGTMRKYDINGNDYNLYSLCRGDK